MDKRKLSAILTLLVIVVTGTFVSAQTEVEKTVEAFYKFYRTRNGQVTTHELNLLKGWFTRDLTQLFRNEIKRESEFTRKNTDAKPYFGDGFPFEPFNECVKGERIILNRLEVKAIKNEFNKAVVGVKFFIPEECETQVANPLIDACQIELLKAGSRWLIADWVYSDGIRLTKILKRERY